MAHIKVWTHRWHTEKYGLIGGRKESKDTYVTHIKVWTDRWHTENYLSRGNIIIYLYLYYSLFLENDLPNRRGSSGIIRDSQAVMHQIFFSSSR